MRKAAFRANRHPARALACAIVAVFVVAFVAVSPRPADAGEPDRAGVFARESHYALLFGSQGGAPEIRFQPSIASTALIPMIPIAGDFDGDGFDSIGLYNAWLRQFHLRDENAPGEADASFEFAHKGFMQPIAGDYDGDGDDTVGLYDPGTGIFRLRNENSAGGAQLTFAFGPVGGIAITGDFDGDGDDTIGVYESKTATFHLRNSNTAGAADHVFQFGPTGSIPFAGDHDGDGDDSIGVSDPATNRLLIRNENSAGNADAVIPLDTADWIWLPLAGRWQIPATVEPPAGYDFPTAAPESVQIDATQLGLALDALDALDVSRSALVLRNGRLVAERYYHGARRDMAGNVKSVSKSILSALVGIAIEQGRLGELHDPIDKHAPEIFTGLVDRAKRALRIDHLLTMTAGLAWDEVNLNPWFYSPDWMRFVIEKPLQTAPGDAFLYSTGLTHLMSRILTNATGMPTHEFARDHLFRPLGMVPARWDQDPHGNDIGGFELYLRPRDMARFGEHFLDHDSALADATVPAAWRDHVTSELVPPSKIDGDLGYGGWWWRKTFGGHDDVYFAWGYGGQFIFLFPSLDLNVTVTSRWLVTGQGATAQAYAIFDWLENQLLPAVN